MVSSALAYDFVNEQVSLVPQILSRQLRQRGTEKLYSSGESQATSQTGCKAEVWGELVGCQSAESRGEVVHADFDLRNARVWSGDDGVEEEEAGFSVD